LRTYDIISTVRRMTERGVEFLSIPETYYENLVKGIANAQIEVKEDIQ